MLLSELWLTVIVAEDELSSLWEEFPNHDGKKLWRTFATLLGVLPKKLAPERGRSCIQTSLVALIRRLFCVIHWVHAPRVEVTRELFQTLGPSTACNTNVFRHFKPNVPD
jgi:hypothetical protein